MQYKAEFLMETDCSANDLVMESTNKQALVRSSQCICDEGRQVHSQYRWIGNMGKRPNKKG